MQTPSPMFHDVEEDTTEHASAHSLEIDGELCDRFGHRKTMFHFGYWVVLLSGAFIVIPLMPGTAG